MATVLENPALERGAERRVLPRWEPALEQHVLTAGPDGRSSSAQVLDANHQGLRLLFRPAVDLDPGMTISVGDPVGQYRDPAAVMWCHHKHHFTVAGVRVLSDRFACISACISARIPAA